MAKAKARTTYTFQCSQEGLEQYAKLIHNYATDISRLNDLFARRLAEEGFDIASMCIQSTDHYDHDKPVGTLEIIRDQTGEVSSCRLTFTGEQVLFIEFGAGFYWNDKAIQTSWAEQFGYGVGTYPGQTHANDEGGWSYFGEDDRWHHTHGTEATMPMYNAKQSMRERFVQIAREVYQSVL